MSIVGRVISGKKPTGKFPLSNVDKNAGLLKKLAQYSLVRLMIVLVSGGLVAWGEEPSAVKSLSREDGKSAEVPRVSLAAARERAELLHAVYSNSLV